jgi:hypothetical protein
MIGENAKMLHEQIEKKKGIITSKRVLSEDEEKEISFSARGKMRGLQMTDIGIFVATHRSGSALSGRGNIVPTSKYAEYASSSGMGIDKVQYCRVSWSRPLYLHIEDPMRRWH